MTVSTQTNLILTGFMGTGKSTLGPLVAKQLQLVFVDLDAMIEQEQKTTIADIFAQQGEASFRDIEHKALSKVLLNKNQVIAVGGGALMFERNRELMQQQARLVCLMASEETLLQRLSQDTQRPLLQADDARQAVLRLWQQRKDVYQSVPWQVSTDQKSYQECVKEICQEWLNPTLPSN